LILKRCPSCRGICDVERNARCFACGDEIPGQAPALKRKRPPRALRVVVKDKKRSAWLLVTFALLGGLGVLGVIASDADPVLRIGLGVLFLAGVGLGFRAMLGRETGTLSHVALRLFAVVGMLIFAVIGLVLLLWIACAVGALR
jgi:hypothetical protein